MATQSMKLQGADFLAKELKRFGPEVEQKAAVRGVRKGAQIIRREMWRLMRQRTGSKDRKGQKRQPGTLKKQIGYKVYKRRALAFVGLRKARSESQGLWYYRTLEFKHARGAGYAPFFVDAVENSKEQAVDEVMKATLKGIYTEAGKVFARSKADQSRYGFRKGRVR